MIIMDTREQLPMWDPKTHEIVSMKLDEGDYTTQRLLNIAHIERKSGADLYGSIIQGHRRFVNEIKRANEKGIRLAVFVECKEEFFLGKKFKYGYRLKTPPSTLKKIIETIKEKYKIDFVWCDDREDMKNRMTLWFAEQEALMLNRK